MICAFLNLQCDGHERRSAQVKKIFRGLYILTRAEKETEVCLAKEDVQCLFQCFTNQNNGGQIINSLHSLVCTIVCIVSMKI